MVFFFLYFIVILLRLVIVVINFGYDENLVKCFEFMFFFLDIVVLRVFSLSFLFLFGLMRLKKF